jgi:hypothetical protein
MNGAAAQAAAILITASLVIAYSLVGMTGILDRQGSEDGCVLVAEFCEEAPR